MLEVIMAILFVICLFIFALILFTMISTISTYHSSCEYAQTRCSANTLIGMMRALPREYVRYSDYYGYVIYDDNKRYEKFTTTNIFGYIKLLWYLKHEKRDEDNDARLEDFSKYIYEKYKSKQ